MNLSDKYLPLFSEESLEKGKVLFEASVVSPYFTSDIEFHAEVNAEVFCDVQLNVKDRKLFVQCDCADAQKGLACAHVWAVLCAAEAFGDLGKATKRSVSKEMCFCDLDGQPLSSPNSGGDSEPVEEVFQVAEERHTLDGDIYYEMEVTEKKPQVVEVEVPEVELDIAKEIVALKEKVGWDEKIDRVVDEASAGFVVDYIVNTVESAQYEELIVQTFWRQLKTDGTWTALQELVANHYEQLPCEIDRTIFKVLDECGQLPKPNSVNPLETLSNVFRLPAAQAHVFLLLAGRSSHLFRRDSIHTTQLYAMQCGLQTSWAFQLSFEMTPEGNLIAGTLQNGQYVMNVTEPIFISEGRFFFTDTSVEILEDHRAYAWLEKLKVHGTLLLPDWEAADFAHDIFTNSSMPTNHFPSKLTFESEVALPIGQIFIKTAKYKYRNQEQLHADISFSYNGQRVKAGSNQLRVVDSESRKVFERDSVAEEKLVAYLNELGFRFNEDPRREEMGWKLLPSKLDDSVKTLVGKGWQVVAQGKTYRKPQELIAKISSGLDWFELEATVDFGEEEMSMPALMAARKKGEDFVLLGDGSFGLLPLDWLKNYTVLTELGLSDAEMLKFKRSQVMLLDTILKKMNVTCDAGFEHARKALSEFDGVKPLAAPDSFQGTLRPYQQEGLAWMVFLQQMGLGGCLADDMGLGKTVQVLALMERQRLAQTGKPSLIVLPKSLIFNWFEEARKFTPKMLVQIHTGAGRDKSGRSFRNFHLILTTYGTLKRDAVSLGDVEFDYCILDESQAIKNPDTEAAKATRIVKADHRIAMSGTPIENHLGELFSQLEFLNPGMTNNSSLLNNFAEKASLTEEDAVALNKALRPFVLRRTKAEVAKDLPPKTEQVIYCELDDWQRQKYDELKAYYQRALLKEKEEPEESQIEILEALLRLRQAACHPGLINDKFANAPSAKLELLMARVKELVAEKHKVLVFSQFTSMLGLVQRSFEAENINFAYLDGQTKDRNEQVRIFQEDPDCEAFLISLKAGGVGLNLTAAEYVFMLDPWWNPAIEAQAIDRAYRIGQKNQVFAYRLIAKDTVEEKVLQMQERKRQLADSVINANRAPVTKITREDLQFILS